MIMFAPHPFLNLRTTTPWIMKLLAANFCENLSNHDAQISSKSSNTLSYHSESSLIRIVDGRAARERTSCRLWTCGAGFDGELGDGRAASAAF